MFIRTLINYGYRIMYGESIPETLADEVKATSQGVLQKNYGLLGGNVFFVNPSPRVTEDGQLLAPDFKTADIFNSLDQQPQGRKAETGLKYLLGGDFLIARTEQNKDEQIALTHHRLFNNSLTRPADYIHSTLMALKKFIMSNGNECSLRLLSTIPLRNSIAKGLFDMDEITPEFNQALMSFTGLMEDKVETLETTIWTKLKLAYYGWVLDYIPKFADAKKLFSTSVDQVITAQENKVFADLKNYTSKTPTNIISLSVIQLIREKIQRENKQMPDDAIHAVLSHYLIHMTMNDLKLFLADPYIRTLPAVISPADMIMIPIICAMTQLAGNQKLQQQLREEIAARDFFTDNNSTRMKSNIENDQRTGGLLHRIFLESLRREYPQKDIHDLERSTLLWRYCQDGMTIGNVSIPPGSLIAVMNALQRFDKKIWHNPEVFDPDRFKKSDGSLNKDLEAVVISIFTDGRRKCPAHRVTEYIFQAYIAHLVANHQLDFVTGIEDTNIDNIHLRLSDVTPNTHRPAMSGTTQ